jgi:hypothetical protein
MVAIPLLSATGPRVAPVRLSRIDAVPVALAGLTVTVSVTVCAKGAGFGVAARATVRPPFTTPVTVADVLAL